MVKIVIGNNNSRILGNLSPEVHKSLDLSLQYKLKDAHFVTNSGKNNRYQNWDGVFRLYKKNQGQSFYTGLLSLAVECLDEHGVQYVKVDQRIRPQQNLPNLTFTPPDGYQKRDYQQFTIERAYRRTRGILKIATGGGKTIVVAELIAKIKTAPFMFYVLTKDLMDQAHETLSKTLNVPIGRIGSGEFEVQDINVCTIQTAIRCLNIGNDKFKISDYQYDEEDKWDKDQIESEDKLQSLKKLISATKGIFLDECVTGDSIVETEKGKVRIDEIKKKECRYVLTHDGNNVTYQKIINFWDQGYRDILNITLHNGEHIRCTADHVILTNAGWKKAGEIEPMDMVLFANADAERGCHLINTGPENTSWDIRLKNDLSMNGTKYLLNTQGSLHFANADAMRKLDRVLEMWNPSLGLEAQEDIQNSFMDTISNPTLCYTILSQQNTKFRQFAERAWEILRFFCQTQGQETIGCAEHMDYVRKNGLITKNTSCLDLELKRKQLPVKDMEKNPLFIAQDACHFYQQLLRNSIAGKTKCQMKAFWKNWGTLDLLGGFAMMGLIPMDAYHYTQKGGMSMKILSSQNGLKKMDSNVLFKKCEKKKKNCITFDLTQKEVKNYIDASENMSPHVCNISWQTIKSIKKEKNQDKVYDIEVENTHCFFANGILVHNCHHASSRTAKEVLMASPDAFFRYGGSATPYREDGAEMMIQAIFGKKIVDINASYLIDRGFLLEPYIIFEPIEHDIAYRAYPTVYKHCISENDWFNQHVANQANFLVANNMSTLVLVKNISHGKALQKLIPGSVFVEGNLAKKKRRQAIQDLRDRTIMCMIATSLADEGLDIPTLDAALLAGGGASETRFHQRVGRTLRIEYGSKLVRDRALVVYYHHNAKHLDGHAKKAKKIAKTEPRFHVVESAGSHAIISEIAEIMSLGSETRSIFDI